MAPREGEEAYTYHKEINKQQKEVSIKEIPNTETTLKKDGWDKYLKVEN